MATLKNTIINDTGHITMPVGTTAQRPGSPATGDFRYNIDDEQFEVYDGITANDWIALAGGGLYEFVDATFNPGTTSATGPSLANAISAMTGTGIDVWKNDTNFFDVSQGIQQWTVPSTGNYTITAAGAKGGEGTAVGSGRPSGNGAIMRATFPLQKSQTLYIIAGARTPTSGEGGGGGGGSYVWNPLNNEPIIIAGGGGGNGDVYQSNAAIATGQPGNTGTSGTSTGNGTGTAGTNGNGGSVDNTDGGPGAGAGFLSDGSDGSSGAQGGHSPFNSGSPGRGGNADSSTGSSTTNAGGFGGGGGESFNGVDAEGGGGGGGYSGGAGSGNDDPGGGGGGSFVAANATAVFTSNGSFSRTGSEPHSPYTGTVGNLSTYNSGAGYVTIIKSGG